LNIVLESSDGDSNKILHKSNLQGKIVLDATKDVDVVERDAGGGNANSKAASTKTATKIAMEFSVLEYAYRYRNCCDETRGTRYLHRETKTFVVPLTKTSKTKGGTGRTTILKSGKYEFPFKVYVNGKLPSTVAYRKTGGNEEFYVKVIYIMLLRTGGV